MTGGGTRGLVLVVSANTAQRCDAMLSLAIDAKKDVAAPRPRRSGRFARGKQFPDYLIGFRLRTELYDWRSSYVAGFIRRTKERAILLLT